MHRKTIKSDSEIKLLADKKRDLKRELGKKDLNIEDNPKRIV
jgi:hypothetical protein